MIDKETLFILGAGSSLPYGFPLAKGLRKKALDQAINLAKDLDRKMNTDYHSQAIEFTEKFRLSSDQSIDWFLKKFPEFLEIGKFLIIDIILKEETISRFREELYPQFSNQDWYWYLYNEMSKYPKGQTDPKQFLNNKVSFITFNYDRSLEEFFYKSFLNGHNFSQINEEPLTFFRKIKIEHVYGKVALLDWETDVIEKNQPKIPYGKYVTNAINFDFLKNNIKLIDERDISDKSNLRSLIEKAERIFFLGFSYAEENLQILDIPNSINEKKIIYGTAYDLTENEIKKIRLKFGNKIRNEKIHFENIDSLGLLRKFL